MEEQEALQILNKVGAVIANSHFVYTHGNHGTTYINKDALYPHNKETSELCRTIAERFAKDNVEVVIAPAIGGVILSQWIAYHLSEITKRKVFAVYAEKIKSSDELAIKRGYDKIVTGRNVLVVEDVITTGGSIKKALEAVRSINGKVVGLGVLCNRGEITPKDVANPPKFFALTQIKLDSWSETECPLCAKNVPINTDFGKGREFLARKKRKLNK
ncbi:MAG: phosphoribosyltransferase family protein [Candidatus Nealsonbacteria bacterium]